MEKVRRKQKKGVYFHKRKVMQMQEEREKDRLQGREAKKIERKTWKNERKRKRVKEIKGGKER